MRFLKIFLTAKYENYDHVAMHGKHTEYMGKFDENDVSVFAS